MRTAASFVVMTCWWHEKAPPAGPAGLCVRVVAVVFELSRWSLLCCYFGDGCAGAGFVDDVLLAGVGGDEGLDGDVVDCPRQTAGDLMDQRDGVVTEQGV